MVTVVIPNYNGAHLLPDCLQSLHDQRGVRVEIVVVDNGSIDESAAVTREYGARWLPLGANRGLAAACNEGSHHAEGEFLFFANSDMRFEPDCLVRLVEVLRGGGDEAFSADPLQFDWEGERVIHFRTVLRRARSVPEAIGEGVFQAPPLIRTFAKTEQVCEIPWGCGGSLMVRRQAFAALGGFDPTFFLDFEDVDLCWRAALRGWTNWFVPQARLYHRWGASNEEPLRVARPDLARRLPRTDRARIISQARNHCCFALKVLESEHAARVVLVKLAAATTYLARGRFALGSAMATGVARALSAWPAIRRQQASLRATACCTSSELIARFADWNAPEARYWPASALAEPAASTAD
jgi:GT2 family glycosyltransferase